MRGTDRRNMENPAALQVQSSRISDFVRVGTEGRVQCCGDAGISACGARGTARRTAAVPGPQGLTSGAR